MAPYDRISQTELSQFLDDVSHNINHDENTDFRMLITYLFGFANARLAMLDKQNNAVNLAMVTRLLDAIELVLSVKKHVINSTISSSEIKEIVTGTQAVQIPAGVSEMPMHEWALHFAILWLLGKDLSAGNLMIIKKFLLEIIQIFTAHLLAFKYRNELRKSLLQGLEGRVATIFERIAQAESADFLTETYLPLLASAVNLYSVIFDYDISHKLLLHGAAWRITSESYARKLSYALGNIDLLSAGILLTDPAVLVIDNLKSILLMLQVSNATLDDHANWTLISLALLWISQHCENCIAHPMDHEARMDQFHQVVSASFEKLALFCCERGLEHNLLNWFLMPPIPQNFPSNSSFQPHYFDIVTRIQKVKSGATHQESNQKYLLLSILGTTPKVTSIKEWNKWAKTFCQKLSASHDRASLYAFVTSFQHIPCYIHNHLGATDSVCLHCSHRNPKNIYEEISSRRPRLSELADASIYFNDIICGSILRYFHTQLEEDPLVALSLLLSIFNLFACFRQPAKDFEHNICFNYVLQQLLKSKFREVRLLAGRILPLFLISESDDSLDRLFRKLFMSISSLKFEAELRTLHLAESTLSSLGGLAVVCDGEWLWVTFMKLIDCLGESNEQHANIAYNTLLVVASAKKMSPYKLLSPYLPSIADKVIRNPSIFNRLIELCGVSRNFLLSHTKDYTTPLFLEYYKYDHAQDIADACHMDKAKLIAKSLSRILAVYLTKSDTIDSRYIINVLSNASPQYRNLRMADLMTNMGEILWYTLLQIQVDDDDAIVNETRIHNAIKYVAKIQWKKTEAGDPPKEEDFDYIRHILGEHVLELVQKFSENVHHIKGIKPYLEKVSSIKAIEFLISKNVDASASALGQISTCLQASLEVTSLELHAIKCWNTLVQKLDPRQLVALFDITISLIFQRFSRLQHRSKLVSIQILERLFNVLLDKYNQYALYYFSIPFIPDLTKYSSRLFSYLGQLKGRHRITIISELIRRLQTYNSYVVHQALDDLLNYISKYQDDFQSEEFRDQANVATISSLVRCLLDLSVQFKSKDGDISTKCAKVLAAIGALDANRFDFKTIRTRIILLNDFRDYGENAKFLNYLIKEKLIKNFWASNDPIKQLFSAYAMQRFLGVMRLDKDILTASSSSARKEVWDEFSEMDKSTLTPLLSSTYFAASPKYEPVSYPIFAAGANFEHWLIAFTTDLLRRPMAYPDLSPLASLVVFQTCSTLIRDEDTSICEFLLKYVAFAHIVSEEKKVSEDILQEFMTVLVTQPGPLNNAEQIDHLKMCYQAVFEVIDYFQEWVSAATQRLSELLVPRSTASTLRRNRLAVEEFLKQIPMELIAITSAECDSFERTILYLEKCYREGITVNGNLHDRTTQKQLNLGSALQSVYASIDDYDALDGVLKRFSTDNLESKLSTFQYNENWEIALESFNVLSEVGSESKKVDLQIKYLKCLADHQRNAEVLNHLYTLSLRSLQEDLKAFAMVGVQAALMEGERHAIEHWVKVASSVGTFQDVLELVNFEHAESLVSIMNHSQREFSGHLEHLYQVIGKSLALSSASSFSRNAELLTQLHGIYDTAVLVTKSTGSGELLSSETDVILKERLRNADVSFDKQWWLLSIHKATKSVLPDANTISDILLKCSAIARANGRLDLSTKCIIKAMGFNDVTANIEYAHLMWDQGKQTEAIKTLSQNLESDSSLQTMRYSTAQLQYAMWLDESSHGSSRDIIAEYSKAQRADWEKPHYELGKYFTKLMESHEDDSGYYEQQIIRQYLKTIAAGPSFVFEALPKLITVWLDFTQKSTSNKDAERRIVRMNEAISSYNKSIPTYVWYTSISQLLSRIIHPQKESVLILMQILGQLIKTYPKHSLWYVLSHIQSHDNKRRRRVGEIIAAAQSTDGELGIKINEAKSLFETMKGIAESKIKKSSKPVLNLHADFHVKDLNTPIDALVIPVKSNLEIRIPAFRHTTKAGSAFPKAASVTFDKFDENVLIFMSLQRPKRISIRGSDNQAYRLMLKEDDTRKDAKVFELTNMINRLLAANAGARKRCLVIENYSVIPLAENSGCIEFVKDVDTLKAAIAQEQKKFGRTSVDRKDMNRLVDAQKVYKSKSGDKQQEFSAVMKVFDHLCEVNPPVLHHWFTDKYSDPAIWYLARKSFTTTAAVMSIVGYIIGLGDRHCENVLLKNNGAVLHIDFDALFEKGASLPTPEIVPFRLTQNMVGAMGITGIEGTYRLTCEATGQLIRENESTLMNILETLLHDPLLDWKNDNPKGRLSKVRRKIRGLLDDEEARPMNIHGQVDVLIQQATSPERLCQMYIGWAPYL